MRHHEVTGPVIVPLLAFTVVILTGGGCGTTEMRPTSSVAPAATDATLSNSRRMVEEGRRTFRFDTSRRSKGLRHGVQGSTVATRLRCPRAVHRCRDMELHERLHNHA